MELETYQTLKRVRPTDRDKRAVLFIAEQGFATINQLWRVIWGDQKSSVYTRRRLLNLERFGFLRSLKISDATQKVFQATYKGKQLVASFAQNILPQGKLSSIMAMHQLELNEVRIALELRGVKNWRSAESLIIDPSFKKLGARHVPDGLYVTSKGERCVVEYDRTMRKKDRIRDRMSSYVSELHSPDRSFDCLIYLVTPMLEVAYRPLFQEGLSSMDGRAILMTLENFLKVFEEVKK